MAWGDAAVLAGLALFALKEVPLAQPALVLAGAALLLACLVRVRRLPLLAAALAGALCLYAAVAWSWFGWPAYLLIPIAVAFALTLAAGRRDSLMEAIRLGRMGRSEAVAILLIGAVTAVALIAWAEAMQPDLSNARSMLPPWPLAGLILAGTVFSVVNAILEEFIWRGVFQRWLMSFAAPTLAIALQALSFGTIHYHGFPGGWTGVGLATIYGLMLGALAFRSGGLLAPIVAHVAADAVIFAVVAGYI